MDTGSIQTYVEGFRSRSKSLLIEEQTRCQEAEKIARLLARRLQTAWGAREVYVFGSLAKKLSGQGIFLPRSDIDLAAAGVDPSRYFRILADLDRTSPFPVDLVLLEECKENHSQTLYTAIMRDGIKLA